MNRLFLFLTIILVSSCLAYLPDASAEERAEGYIVELSVAALPAVVPRQQGSYAAGVSGIGLINPASGEWVSLGLVPRLGRSKKISWNTADRLVFYQQASVIAASENDDSIEMPGLGPNTVSSAENRRTVVVGDTNGQEEEGKPIPVASTRLPHGEGPYLLLLGPGQGSGERYRIWVLPDDRLSFPGGSLKLINTSAVALACEVGGEQFILESGAEKTVRTRLAEVAAVPIRLAAFDDERNAWRQTWGTSFGMAPNERRLLLIPPGTDSRLHNPPLSIRGFD